LICECEEEANSFFVLVKETPALWEKEVFPKCGGTVRCYDHVEVAEVAAFERV
jgi:hypothetical protein